MNPLSVEINRNKQNMKKMILLFLTLAGVASMQAQKQRMPKYRLTDNMSFSVGAGANMTFSDRYKTISNRNWGPNAIVSISKDCTPVLGTRLQFGWSKMAINNYITKYGMSHPKAF